MKNTLKKVIAIVLVLGTLLTLCSCGSVGSKKVDLKDYVNITYDGYSGEAICAFYFDYDGLMELVDAKKRNKKVVKLAKENDLEDDSEDLVEELSDMSNWIRVRLCEDYRDISNGDKLKVAVEVYDGLERLFGFEMEDVEKYLGLSFESTEFEIEATGIKEYTKIDLFAEIKQFITFDEYAVSGEAYPTLNIPEGFSAQVGEITIKKGTAYCDVDFYNGDSLLGRINITTKEPASSGEKYELTIEPGVYLESNLKYYGYKFASMTKEFTAPVLGERIVSAKELSAKDIQKIKEEVTKQCAEEEKPILEFKYLYLCTPNSGAEEGAKPIALAAVNVEDFLFGKKGVFISIKLVRNAKGELLVDAYSYNTAYESMEERITNDVNYDYESLI